ncbi:MAG: extensin family protein [Labilithrix sp.]|nr:extensin family protein [Labilithrix sp.]
MRPVVWLIAIALLACASPARADYALDALDREGPEQGKKPVCSREDLVTYRGTTLKYAAPASVHRAFAERLARFEKIVEEVAIEVYGRAPSRLHHAGGFMCRTSWRGRMSEHAFGNALDVAGFSFTAMSKADLARAKARGLDLEASRRRAFRVDVGDTWRENGKADAKRFFALLLARTRPRHDLFRGIIGPPDPAHTTHLHLDAGRWAFSRYVSPG